MIKNPNKLGIQACKTLKRVLLNSKILTILCLEGLNIDDQFMKLLIDGMGGCESL